MANWYVSSVGYAAVAQWAANTVYGAAAIVRQLTSPAVGSERCFRTVAGGTSHATTEPVWDLSHGATQPTDGTVVWVEVTGTETYQSPGAWAAPYARLNTATFGQYSTSASVSNGGTAGTYLVGDVLTVSSNETVQYGSHSVWKVATVTGSQVATVTRVNGGSFSGTTATFFGATTTGGGGSGCTLNLTTANLSGAGDQFFVASNHAETQSTALSIQSRATSTSTQPVIMCVNESGTGHVPPTGADPLTTATVSTTGNSSLTLTNLGYADGITFTSGSGAVGAALTLSGNVFLRNSSLVHGGTSSALLTLGDTTSSKITLENTTVKFGNVGSSIGVIGNFCWKKTSSAISGATFPTTLLVAGSSGVIGKFLVVGVDLSALGSGKTIVGAGSAGNHPMVFVDCKLSSLVSPVTTSTSITNGPVDFIRCGSGPTPYRHERYSFEGSQTMETTLVRNGGASDRSTSVSWKLVTTANLAWWHPYESFQLGIDNSTTASNVTVTIYGITNSSGLPNNDDVWPDVTYLGSSGSPISSIQTGSKTDVLAAGSAWTGDSVSAWDTLVAVRQNSHTYSIGDMIKVATNTGRVFFCTASSGNTAGSEPGGYASAVDGGVVTDGSATFRAGVRFSMAVVLSSPQPQLAGDLTVTVKAALASSTFYLDPVPYLS